MSGKIINNKQIIYYSLLAFPLAFIALPIYIYLPNFYESNFNISLQTVGLILLISRIFDAAFDPIIGWFGDKNQYLRKKLILISSIALGISFILLFNPLIKNTTLWLFVILFAVYFFFSVAQINYQSLAVNFSKNYNLKTRIIATRETFGVIGIVFASIVPALLFLKFSQEKSFLIISCTYLALISFLAIIFYLKSPDIYNKQIKKGTKYNFTFLKNAKIKSIFTVFFFNSCTFGITSSLMLFFVQTVLDAENFTSLFLMLYFTGLLLGIPFFAWLAKKMQSKIKAWKLSMILIVVIFSFCIFLSSGDIWQYALICLASGFCFGADYCLSYSILTDIIQDEDLQTRQTSIFGSINFIIKFCFAFASGILIFLLGWVQAEFPDSQTSFLLISYCLLPCFFKIITYLTLNNFLKEYA